MPKLVIFDSAHIVDNSSNIHVPPFILEDAIVHDPNSQMQCILNLKQRDPEITWGAAPLAKPDEYLPSQ